MEVTHFEASLMESSKRLRDKVEKTLARKREVGSSWNSVLCLFISASAAVLGFGLILTAGDAHSHALGTGFFILGIGSGAIQMYTERQKFPKPKPLNYGERHLLGRLGEIELILERTDTLIEGFKARRGADAKILKTIDEELCATDLALWNERAARIESEIDALFAEIGRLNDLENKIDAFRVTAGQLLELERALDTVAKDERAGQTSDLSSEVLAVQLRRSLETERETLGLPLSDLPERRVSSGVSERLKRLGSVKR